ncbi:MAG: flavodoxin domain-containing protein, partial [Elusimicrobiota bacterium]|nr:flavodoxin domain-containing protein [Elusimicrobiota bacterium]
MSKIIIIYYSETGNTKKMAELIAEGVKEEKVDVVVKNV